MNLFLAWLCRELLDIRDNPSPAKIDNIKIQIQAYMLDWEE
jgi:hypothetical protein